jgi:hypothetical protein
MAALLVTALGFLAVGQVRTAEAAISFTVTDSDFVDGVYDFHYYTFPNTAAQAVAKRTVINGIDQVISDPTLTNFGWEFGDPYTPSIGFWAAAGPFGATNTAGEITMGWDFAAITGQIEKVELRTRNFLFQFPPWTGHAVGDEIAGFVATPNSFGTGAFTQLYSFVGNNTIDTIGSALVEDITTSLPSAWLMNPVLLELKFTYSQTPTPTIPGRHIQIFRDNTGTDDDGFVLRVTLAAANTLNGGDAGFLSPLGGDPITVKKNRVIPFKVELRDGDDYLITDQDITAPPVIQVSFDDGFSPAEDVTGDALPAGQGTDGNQFEFNDPVWQYNLKTKNYSASGTYTVSIVSGDASEYVINPLVEAQFVIE